MILLGLYLLTYKEQEKVVIVTNLGHVYRQITEDLAKLQGSAPFTSIVCEKTLDFKGISPNTYVLIDEGDLYLESFIV